MQCAARCPARHGVAAQSHCATVVPQQCATSTQVAISVVDSGGDGLGDTVLILVGGQHSTQSLQRPPACSVRSHCRLWLPGRGTLPSGRAHIGTFVIGAEAVGTMRDSTPTPDAFGETASEYAARPAPVALYVCTGMLAWHSAVAAQDCLTFVTIAAISSRRWRARAVGSGSHACWRRLECSTARPSTQRRASRKKRMRRSLRPWTRRSMHCRSTSRLSCTSRGKPMQSQAKAKRSEAKALLACRFAVCGGTGPSVRRSMSTL